MEVEHDQPLMTHSTGFHSSSWLAAFKKRFVAPPPVPLDRFRIAIIGDLRLDVRTAVEPSLQESTADVFCSAPISVNLAGTAVGMARAAAVHFATVETLVTIGQDDLSLHVRDLLDNEPGRWVIRQQEGVGCGYVMILRDGMLASSKGRRVLVASSPAPIETLSILDISSFRHAIEAADLLFVDGYPLLFPEARKALLHAIEIARRTSTPICFDMVPHDISCRLPREILLRVIEESRVVIANGSTAAGLCGVPGPFPLQRGQVASLARLLSDTAPSARKILWIIRFGDGEMEESALCLNGELLCAYHTGYVDATQAAGFGDRVAAAELAAILETYRL